MESKIPYKKDLIIKTDEEVDYMEAKENKEKLDKSISEFDSHIASEINYIATETKQRYVSYNLRDMNDFTYNKENQKIIIETVQLELTKKGYANYITKIKFDDGDKLVILLDDNVKDEVDKYIKQLNKNNIKMVVITSAIMLLIIAVATTMLCKL